METAMKDLLRTARMIRRVKGRLRPDGRETVEGKIRRWQLLETPELPEEILRVDAQRDWSAIFEREKGRLLAALGGVTAVGEVEHIGSTSIPGLAGKPIIDLLIAVRAPRLAAETIDALAGVGYTLYGPSPCDPEASWLWKVAADHAVVAHLCELGNPWIPVAVDFRDYMRVHPADCAAYEAHKRQLAADRRLSPLEYSLEKLVLWSEISARAGAWAAETKRPADPAGRVRAEGRSV